MRIYIYKDAKKRIAADHEAGGTSALFNEDGEMDYLLGTTQEVEYVSGYGDYRIKAEKVRYWAISPCACKERKS